MNGKVKLARKILTPVSKVMVFGFTLAFGVLNVGTALANANASVVTSFLGGGGNNIVYVDDGTVSDSDYYKSEFASVNEVRTSGIGYTQTVMEEGAVLLRNENDALPLKSTDKVSLFSASSAKPVISGYRESGKNKDVVSFKDGLESAGIEINTELYDWYAASNYGRQSLFGNTGFGNVYNINEAPWDKLPASKTAAGFNTAVFVISRIAGEATDVQLRDLGEKNYTANATFDGKNGNYLVLSNEEEDVLAHLKEEKGKTFDKIIVIMNTTNQVACDFEDKYGVDALIYSGSTGTAGTKAIGNILAGKVNPSGKLSDTFWKNHYLNPVLTNWGAEKFNATSEPHYNGFGYNGSTEYSAVVYQEGIYSGYRYTETRYEDNILGTANNSGYVYNDVVAYPFGYGISYSDFDYSDMTVTYDAETDDYNVSVKVKNVNGMDGKNSVQLFLQKPYTEYDKTKGIEKAAVELVDFAKTGVLSVDGEGETVNFTVARRELASYDSYGERTYILENGNYYFAVGTDAHDAVNNIIAAKGKSGMTDATGKA
ncbi:MAG: glycoside hydrolase family 3 C-terminal domain-containing protein, partial [Clostridia bacterium]|nr:glycoside hydrolase family 3 C-terminal domain-containing protein [Clostridia bacterium]